MTNPLLVTNPTPPKRAVLYVRWEPYTGALTDPEFDATTEAVDRAIPGIKWTDPASYEEKATTKFLADLLLEARKDPYGLVFVVDRLEHLAKADRLLPVLLEISESPAYFYSNREPAFRWVQPADFPSFIETLGALREFREAQIVSRRQRAKKGLSLAKKAGRKIGRNARTPCVCTHRHTAFILLADGTQKRLAKPIDRCPVDLCPCTVYRPVPTVL